MGTRRKDERRERPDEEVGQTREQIEELESRLELVGRRIARGTEDVVQQLESSLRRAGAPIDPADIRARLHEAVVIRSRVEQVITDASLSADQISNLIGEPAPKVLDVLSLLRVDERVFNMGTANHPRWTLRAGTKVSAQRLRVIVERLLAERPMSADELADATGATTNRVRLAVGAVCASGANVLLVEGRWFRVPDGSTKVLPRSRRRSR
jgi:hypothetical protein